MDSKTKHRLLGILVIIGLAVIMYPFFQSNKDFSKEAKAVIAPPFPDQSVQVATIAPEIPIDAEEQSIPIPPNNLLQANETVTNPQPDDTISMTHPTVTHEPNITTMHTHQSELKPSVQVENTMREPQKINQAQRQLVEVKSPQKPLAIPPKIKEITQKPVVKKLAQHVHKKPIPQTPLDDDGLFKLKNAAWVIQLGSFNKKENALRLVNQLRANGYRAFIQHISTKFGDSTRVFVGPEIKHDEARALAAQLETDLHLHGMIISYKPLAL